MTGTAMGEASGDRFVSVENLIGSAHRDWLSGNALAQVAGPSGPAVQQPTSPDAALTFYNRNLITFRGEMAGISAEDRAQRAHTRLQAQLAQAGPHLVSQKPDTMGILIQIDGATTFVVTPAEVDISARDTLEATALRAQRALEAAIAQSRESRDLDALARAFAWVAGATAVAIALWAALKRLHIAAGKRLLQLSAEHAARLQLGGISLLNNGRELFVAATVEVFLELATLALKLAVLIDQLLLASGALGLGQGRRFALKLFGGLLEAIAGFHQFFFPARELLLQFGLCLLGSRRLTEDAFGIDKTHLEVLSLSQPGHTSRSGQHGHGDFLTNRVH